jgi:Zn-dependent M16 (insulinase) family peptidase
MWKENEKYKDFVVKKVMPLEELKATLIELEHVPSGAQIMQIENDDPENLFCLSFETLPYSSNGVAHILEHTVLCGSRKFPVKDPFFAMTRRSLNTFMNALTGSDFTCYPASSQVEKDFYNLLDVYIDAVFHPLLKKESFLQEGHRLEFADPQKLAGLEWKGIVYNEMKGALASADTRLWHEMMHSLVPNLTYAHISGGDPKIIPSLTYEELIQFHETYYHPSRCLYFFYGNIPLKKHLDFLSEKILKSTYKLPPLPRIPRQPRFTAPIEREGFYPATNVEDMDDKTMVAWGWLTVPMQDQETLLALTLLDAVLMETDASLIKLPLLQSGLCTSADAYLDTDMSEMPYMIVCKGCDPENVQALDDLLLRSLQDVLDNGIPEHMIEAALHQLEFARTEITGDHAPFGLTLFMRSALAKQHGCPPENALLIHSLFEKLREKLQDPLYLPGLLKTYLLKNPHRVRLSFHPDPKLGSREADEEKHRLKALEQDLPREEKEKIVQQMHHLEHYQQKLVEQNIDCLPKVTLDDVPVLAKHFVLKEKNEVFSHSCFTNHIIYADLFFDLPHIEEEDLPYVQLLSMIVSELGMGKRNYIKNLEYLQSHVGGLGTSLSLSVQAESPHLTKPSFAIRGKALERNAKELFSIFKDLSLHARVDEKKRIEELILQIHTGLQNRLQKNSLRYATQLALSGLSVSSKIIESWGGLSFVKWIQEIVSDLPGKLPKVMQRLEKLKNQVISLHNAQLVVTCDEPMHQKLELEDYFGVLDLPKRPFNPWKGDYEIYPVVSQGRSMATPVAFTCEAYPVGAYLNPHAPGLTVAGHIIDNKILHPKIREQGGAYGCGATYSPMTGHFTLFSYRDPKIASTLKIFREAVETIAEGHFKDSDIEEAKLETMQHMDIPIAPGSRGLTAYAWMREGKTPKQRQHYRDRLLALTPQEIRLAVKKELLDKLGSGTIVTFASKELLEKENADLEKPLPIIPV